MITKNSASFIINILSLLFFTGLTIAALLMDEITIFYVIYIFWWDEIIKTVFDFFRYVFRKNEIEDRIKYKEDIKTRFFLLFLYVVFIIVCFCLMIEWNNTDRISKNAHILLFQNSYFNISLVSFISREIYLYSNKTVSTKKLLRTVMSEGVITLHVSIILGILLWAMATKKIGSLPFDLESYSTILAIVPFLLIKFLFEWSEIKRSTIQNK